MTRKMSLRPLVLRLVLIWGLLGPVGTVGADWPCGATDQTALGDFNDDGRQDLAVGSPESYVVVNAAGLVHVIYGTDNGPGSGVLPPQIWHLDRPDVPGDPSSLALFGDALAVGDFDCDGVDDLAIGEDEAVTVLYGKDPDGLVATDSQRLLAPFESDFGRALAAGNFGDQQGCGDDLAVGAPLGSGRIFVYFGAPGSGLVPQSETEVHQGSPGVPGSPESGDRFGSFLVAGNFDDEPFDDLAVGVYGENIGTFGTKDGAANILYGGPDGFDLSRSQIWHQAVDFIPGDAESFDGFGKILAVGDFDGDGYDDLVAAVPGEGDEGIPGILSDGEPMTGAVNVIYGSPDGLQATEDVPGGFWWQDSPGILGKSDDWDRFGSSVVGGDFDGNGRDDVAIGTIWEDREGHALNAGAVNVIFGGPSGLSATGNQLVHQNTTGEWVPGAIQVLGDLEDYDHFGCSMAAGPLNDDGYDDLVVTVEDGPGVAFNLVYGSDSGLTETGNTHWICEGLEGCSAFRSIINAPSASVPVTDGLFTDPPGSGEWSDVVPLAFTIGGQGPVVVDPMDTEMVDSAFFASLGPEPDPEVAHIHLLFDLVLRTDTGASWEDPVATIRFPAKLPGTTETQIIGVHLLGSGPGPAWPPSAWLDLDGDDLPDDTTGGSEPNVPASSLGIEVAADFAPSPYESTPHLVIEMKMPLDIPVGFPDPTGPLATVPDGPGGVYRPDPGLWTVEYRRTLAPDWIWEVGAMGTVEIRPDGVSRGAADLAIDRLVAVELLDDVGDGDGLARFAILSTPYFDARTLASVRAVNAGDPGPSAWSTDLYAQYVNGDVFEDQVVEFASADMLANGVVTANGTEVTLIGENGSETVAGSVTGSTLPQAGRIPDSFVPGAVPMTITKSGNGNNLKLYWNPSCEASDTDYAIYEGTLGAPGSHRPVVCSTGGATTLKVPLEPGDLYYLVVPTSIDGVEGSYGATSWGEERPPGFSLLGDPFAPATCVPQPAVSDCGM